jgi:hypothetical protein
VARRLAAFLTRTRRRRTAGLIATTGQAPVELSSVVRTFGEPPATAAGGSTARWSRNSVSASSAERAGRGRHPRRPHDRPCGRSRCHPRPRTHPGGRWADGIGPRSFGSAAQVVPPVFLGWRGHRRAVLEGPRPAGCLEQRWRVHHHSTRAQPRGRRSAGHREFDDPRCRSDRVDVLSSTPSPPKAHPGGRRAKRSAVPRGLFAVDLGEWSPGLSGGRPARRFGGPEWLRRGGPET